MRKTKITSTRMPLIGIGMMSLHLKIDSRVHTLIVKRGLGCGRRVVRGTGEC